MPTEIERKFLLRSDDWRAGVQGKRYAQGYLSRQPTVRVRTAEGAAWLTIKGPAEGLVRPEYEYEVPLADAQEMLATLCQRPLIVKTRYRVKVGEHVWDIDEFHEENAGLVLAELELSAPGEAFERPAWLGREVTGDARYYNSSLVVKPYSAWDTR